jgi:hypothetical protein
MVKEFDEVKERDAISRCRSLPITGRPDQHTDRPVYMCAFQVVFGGQPGVLYGPVKTQFGYHLIVVKSLS